MLNIRILLGIFFYIIFNTKLFAVVSSYSVLDQLTTRLSAANFSTQQSEKFKKIYKQKISAIPELANYIIIEVQYNKQEKKFATIIINGEDNNDLQKRIDLLKNFLDKKIIPVTKLDKNFSFFVSMADSAGLPDKFINEYNLKEVPFFVFDLEVENYQKQKELVFLMPDLYLLSKNYEYQRKKIIKETRKKTYFLKKDIAIWRGAQTGGVYNLEAKEAYPRAKLVWFSYANPEYVDARFVSYDVQVENSKSGEEYIKLMQKTFGENPEKYFMTFNKMTHYKYNVSLDGNISAWQRVPWILGSGTVLLYNSNFVQYFTPYLKENVHYVAIKSDMSDIKQKIDFLRKHPLLAYKITKNAAKLQNEILTQDFIVSYYAKVIQGISDKYS